MRFKDKIVLVTGSSQGIGAEIVAQFASEGAKVIINYKSNEEKANNLYSSIDSKDNSLLVKADVSNFDEVDSMFKKILDCFGGIDILVNNAAIYKDSTIWNMDEKTWKDIIDTDLTGAFNCTKFASKIMRDSNFGRIINICSVVGQTSSFGTSNYAAAKAGLLGFTRGVATDLARNNITVNALSLGFIETGMLLRLSEEVRKIILAKIPVGRWGKLDEVVEAVFFLASEKNGYITGQTINLNGGYLM